MTYEKLRYLEQLLSSIYSNGIQKHREEIESYFKENYGEDSLVKPVLEEDDIKSQTMGMTGEDIILTPAARKLIPYSFECKNQERIQMWKFLEQAEANAGEHTPVLVVKKNRTKPYVVLDLDEWIKLIK